MYLVHYLEETLGITVVSLILLLVVLISNTLVVVVWLSPKMITPVSILLSLIAIYDLITVAFGGVFSLAEYIAGRMLSVVGCYFAKLSLYFAFIFHSLSIMSTIFLAIQRCSVCVFPFSGPRYCGMKSTKIFIIVSILIVVIPNSFDLLFYSIDGTETINEQNVTILKCTVNTVLDIQTTGNVLKVFFISRVIGLNMLPEGVVTFCMIVIVLTVNRKKMVTGKSSDQRQKTRTTIMLVLIMTIFVIGEFPTTVRLFYVAFLPESKPWIINETAFWFCNILVVTSYLLNIWVYIIMSREFREKLKEQFCRPKKAPTRSETPALVDIATVSTKVP